MSLPAHRLASLFLDMLAAERGAAANTLAAYRRDLEDYLEYLAETGTAPLEAQPATISGFLLSLEERGLKSSAAARRLEEGPMGLATGGGAFMKAETRTRIAATAVSVWLKVDHETLMRRVRRRSNRPLLANPDPEGTMRRLMAERYPIYAEANLAVESSDMPHERVVSQVVSALESWFDAHEGEA